MMKDLTVVLLCLLGLGCIVGVAFDLSTVFGFFVLGVFLITAAIGISE
jgi:hypothetical protein